MANLSNIVGQTITNIDLTSKTIVVYTEGGQLSVNAEGDGERIVVNADE